MDVAPPGDLGAALVGKRLLYWWPGEGWQRGTVARLCTRGAFSHVVAYTRQTSALRGTADTLLDRRRCVIRFPMGAPLPCSCHQGSPIPAAPHSPALTLSLVCGSSQFGRPAPARALDPGPGQATSFKFQM